MQRVRWWLLWLSLFVFVDDDCCVTNYLFAAFYAMNDEAFLLWGVLHCEDAGGVFCGANFSDSFRHVSTCVTVMVLVICDRWCVLQTLVLHMLKLSWMATWSSPMLLGVFHHNSSLVWPRTVGSAARCRFFTFHTTQKKRAAPWRLPYYTSSLHNEVSTFKSNNIVV